MGQRNYLRLDDRAPVAVSGEAARPFLQGLISNDVEKVGPDRAIYAALLTPQGKYLHDFFVVAGGDILFLDCEAARRDDLLRRLTMYRLRTAVELAPVEDDRAIYALFGAGALAALGLADEPGRARAFAGGIVYTDPRLAEAGARAMLPRAAEAELEKAGFAPGNENSYDRLRLSLGLPDGSRDLEIEKSVLLENGIDRLNGVDWDKGCYVGQEITARTHYRGLVKKRLLPVEIDGELPAPGTAVTADGKEVGTMRSGRDGLALALLRLDAVESGATLSAGAARLRPLKRDWLGL